MSSLYGNNAPSRLAHKSLHSFRSAFRFADTFGSLTRSWSAIVLSLTLASELQSVDFVSCNFIIQNCPRQKQ